jgi:hypothetical protein
MPAKKRASHQYGVFVDYPDEQRNVMVYMGSSERQASFLFYKAARSAKPGTVVIMKQDGEVIIRFAVPAG